MRILNPAHLEALKKLNNESPFYKLVGIEIEDLGQGYALVRVDLAYKHLNPFGGIHGGVYSSLIDTAAYWAVYCEIEEDVGLISLDLKVDNLAPVKEGRLMVKGKRIKTGRSVCLAEALITDEEGKPLAHGTSKQIVTRGLQTINQAVIAMGGEALPPKFLSEKPV